IPKEANSSKISPCAPAASSAPRARPLMFLACRAGTFRTPSRGGLPAGGASARGRGYHDQRDLLAMFAGTVRRALRLEGPEPLDHDFWFSTIRSTPRDRLDLQRLSRCPASE